MAKKSAWKRHADELVRNGDPTITFYYEYEGITYSYTPRRPKPKKVRTKIEYTPIKCDQCSIEFIPKNSQQHFCSDECRIKSQRDALAEKNHSRTLSYTCKNCGKEFTHWRKGRQFCCEKCNNRYSSHKNMNEAEWAVHLNNISIYPQEYLDKHNINADYVSGWKGVDHSCIVRCKACGSEYEAKMGAVRKGRITPCPTCTLKKIEQKEQQRANAKAEREAAKKKLQDENKLARESLREQKKRVVTCDICGLIFVTYKKNAKRCSKECTQKYYNLFTSKRKDTRLKGVKRDTGINAKSLMKRDKGICYICGKPCSLDDYKLNDNGSFIAGDMYPSVDHILAISNGGTDTWDNVRLAHRKCNNAKRDRLIETQSGQLGMFYGA